MERQDRVEELFHEALALAPEARASFLAEACATEPGLREEIESLISAHEMPGSFIETLPLSALELLDEDLSGSLVGTSIGRYKVIRLIKRSGMGEVYLARDTHLPRDVALKLLPLAFTGEESRLRRFVLEAEAVSSLNHPNILTIHEIGHIDDLHFIATEFVDGQTLRERLSGGRLGVAESVELAIGVASALVASHAAGIVHRDIKPENVMIRRDGYVKVLDFGLAKLTEKPDPRVDGAGARVSMMETDPGTLMGTIGYLSPEQAATRAVDTRSDLFSLGVVLYEMIAGRSPFGGETAADVIAAILEAEPPRLTASAPDAPDSLQRVVTKALRKDKEERYQRAEELLADLNAVKAEVAQLPAGRGSGGPRRTRVGVGIALAAAAAAALAVAGLRPLRPSRGAAEAGASFARLGFTELHSWKSERGEGSIDARFSNDGRLIAFTMLRNGSESIWVKQASSGAEPRQVTTDAEDNSWPVWSPDDRRLAFASIREGRMGIWSAPAEGGPATLLGHVDGRAARPVRWSTDGRTIYYESKNNLFGLDVSAGTSAQLTQLEPRPTYRHFSVSPSEDRVCYVEVQDGQHDIWAAPLRGGGAAFKVTDDAEVDRAPFWHPDGRRIVYTSNRGGAFQVCVAYVDGAPPNQITVGAADHVVSDIAGDGTRLLDVSSRDEAHVFRVDTPTGREIELTSGSGLNLWPEVSPDGRVVVFQTTNAAGKIASNSTVTAKGATTGEGPLTPVASNGFAPSWSPDGKRIAFLRSAGGKADLFTVDASGADERRLTTDGVAVRRYHLLPADKFGTNLCWSAGGDRIVYSSRASGAHNLWAVASDGSARTRLTANDDPNRLLYEFACGPEDRLAFATEVGNGPSRVWSLWVMDKDKAKLVVEARSLLRPVGWTAAGDLLFARDAQEVNPAPTQGYPMRLALFRVSADGHSRPVATLESTYFWTVQLAPDGRTVAFISDRDRADNIWLSDVRGGEARRLTSNNEPKIYLTSFDWSADGKSIYYGKQSSIGLITMIDNFE